MEKKNRYTYTELVEALERDKPMAAWRAISYSTTLAMHSALLLSMAISGEHHSPVEYANGMTGKAFTLDEMRSYIKAAEKLHMGLCDTDKLRWIVYYSKYVEDHAGAFHTKPGWKQLWLGMRALCKIEKAKFVARREEK